MSTKLLKISVVVLEESPYPCPRGPIYKSLSLDHKVLENFQGLRVLQTVRYVWSRDVHKFCYRHRAWGYSEECLSYWCHILLTDIMSASKPFFTVTTQCCCPRGKSLSSSHKSLNPTLLLTYHVIDVTRAGKTTLLYKLKLNETVSTIPTIGFNVETVTPCRGVSFTVWDVGGQDKLRPLWRHYFQNAEGRLHVVTFCFWL